MHAWGPLAPGWRIRCFGRHSPHNFFLESVLTNIYWGPWESGCRLDFSERHSLRKFLFESVLTNMCGAMRARMPDRLSPWGLTFPAQRNVFTESVLKIACLGNMSARMPDRVLVAAFSTHVFNDSVLKNACLRAMGSLPDDGSSA